MSSKGWATLIWVLAFYEICWLLSGCATTINAVSTSQSQGIDLGSDLDRGLRLLKQKRYHQAVSWLQQAIVVDPDSATAHAALGWAYYNLGQFKSALAEAEIVISLEPNHPDLPLLIRYLRRHR
ncbi:MAG: tetratricopeptide repeat protein [Candidatus Poribacteria bacterium]|jgi:Tfp pilus assembly protein PilF|nr:tetratricopeptide repeat protein [Candidatus Poribacteria bacterium]MDP6747409.1 tetratricopeptide repeat protein [Candidatus Poribacteria bacterium]MDP6998641.1 tetratricopeptide repeat protein [Candidatus Poribacteria bacterium]